MGKKLLRLLCVLLLACLLSVGSDASSALKARSVSLPVVMYHQINPDPASWGAWTIPPETLRGDLEYLRDHGYTTVTPDMLAAYTRGEGTLPSKPILITFDDGYESFAAYALPLFEEFGMTAVISMVGGYADTYTEHADHDLTHSYFSWPALAELLESPAVELGSHTYAMHDAPGRAGCTISPGESLEDYRSAFGGDCALEEARFEAYLGVKPILFAYPSGLYCDEARDVLRERGYQILLTTDQKVNRLTGDPEELLDLGRFNRGAGLDRERFFSILSR